MGGKWPCLRAGFNLKTFRKGQPVWRRIVGRAVLAVLVPAGAVALPIRAAPSAHADALPAQAAAEPVVVVSHDFEDGTTQGWFARGSAAVTAEQLTVSDADAHSGQYSLLTANRSQTYSGPALNLLGKVGKGPSTRSRCGSSSHPASPPANCG